VRGYSNLYGYNPGDLVPGLEAQVIGPGRFVELLPDCPGGGGYTIASPEQVPSLGVLYMTCDLAPSEDHEPADHTDW